MDPKDYKKFEKDVSQNHDTADVKAALERETADGSGFEDESELDQYEQLSAEDVVSDESSLEALKPEAEASE